MSGSNISSRGRSLALIAGGIVIGVVGFLAGRLSVQRDAVQTVSSVTGDEVSPASSTNESSSKTVSPPSAKSQNPAVSVASLPVWDEKQWEQTLSRPGSPARQAALAELVEKLAAAD